MERFRREAKAAAGLNQQNLVAIYDWGELDGTYYIVMEYVEGETLKDLIRRRGRLSGNESVAVALQLLAAVDFAHRSGIVHRDIKPQNVMLDRAGTVKVMDFGIARAGDSGMTEAGSILGTAQYLAPEQAKGYPVDERSDLYSVGVVPLRDAHRHGPVQGRQRRHRRAQARERDAARSRPSWCRACPTRSTRSCSRRWPRTRPTGTSRRPSSRATCAPPRRAAPCRRPPSTPAASARASWAPPAGGRRTPRPCSTSRMPPRRKKSRWPLVLIILLLAIIAAVAVALWWTMSGNKVEVPSVVGLSRAAAVKALENDGFKAGVQEEFSDRVAEGFVSRQAPTGGTKLREGATVDIWVSKGSADGVTLAGLHGLDGERGGRLAERATTCVGEREDRQVEQGRRRARCSSRTRRPRPRSTAATPSRTGSAAASRRRRCPTWPT